GGRVRDVGPQRVQRRMGGRMRQGARRPDHDVRVEQREHESLTIPLCLERVVEDDLAAVEEDAPPEFGHPLEGGADDASDFQPVDRGAEDAVRAHGASLPTATAPASACSIIWVVSHSVVAATRRTESACAWVLTAWRMAARTCCACFSSIAACATK